MINVVIRKGEVTDLPNLLELIKELAAFEKAADSVTNTLSRMSSERDLFDFIIVETEGKVIGMAIYFFAYYSWVGKSLYLDDLYIKPEYRNKKIGARLLRKIFEIAKKENCQRLRWQVLNWNTEAISFYKKNGVHANSEWLNCDADSTLINRFLNA